MGDAEIELLVRNLGNLPEILRSALYDSLKNGLPHDEMISLIDMRFKASPLCGHCKSPSFHRWSSQNGLSRYRCKDCRRTFNALTSTPLAHLHRRDAWFSYAQELVSGTTLRDAAQNCDLALETAFRWRHRFSNRASQKHSEKKQQKSKKVEKKSNSEI